jgi:MtN3 and saliva related transmembrane protein
MDMVTIVGLAAAVLSTISFLPQAIKTIKTKHTEDLSLGMYSIYSLGVVLWLAYGIMLNKLPIILANVVTLTFTIVILVQIIRNTKVF